MALGEVLWCVNQSLPSGPAVMAPGWLGVGIANSVIVMSGPLICIAGGPPPALRLPPVPVVPPPAPPVVVAVGLVPAAPPLPADGVAPLAPALVAVVLPVGVPLPAGTPRVPEPGAPAVR